MSNSYSKFQGKTIMNKLNTTKAQADLVLSELATV